MNPRGIKPARRDNSVQSKSDAYPKKFVNHCIQCFSRWVGLTWLQMWMI